MTEFLVSADFALRWTRDAMTQDLSYHRVRQSLWEKMTARLDDNPPNPPYVVAVDRWLLVFRQFLTARNEAINDNMRLAFDVALRELRSAVRMNAASVGAPAGPSETEGRVVRQRVD